MNNGVLYWGKLSIETKWNWLGSPGEICLRIPYKNIRTLPTMIALRNAIKHVVVRRLEIMNGDASLPESIEVYCQVEKDVGCVAIIKMETNDSKIFGYFRMWEEALEHRRGK